MTIGIEKMTKEQQYEYYLSKTNHEVINLDTEPQRLSKSVATPIDALLELVYNSIDADANDIRIYMDTDKFEVVDNGRGIASNLSEMLNKIKLGKNSISEGGTYSITGQGLKGGGFALSKNYSFNIYTKMAGRDIIGFTMDKMYIVLPPAVQKPIEIPVDISNKLELMGHGTIICGYLKESFCSPHAIYKRLILSQALELQLFDYLANHPNCTISVNDDPIRRVDLLERDNKNVSQLVNKQIVYNGCTFDISLIFIPPHTRSDFEQGGVFYHNNKTKWALAGVYIIVDGRIVSHGYVPDITSGADGLYEWYYSQAKEIAGIKYRGDSPFLKNGSTTDRNIRIVIKTTKDVFVNNILSNPPSGGNAQITAEVLAQLLGDKDICEAYSIAKNITAGQKHVAEWKSGTGYLTLTEDKQKLIESLIPTTKVRQDKIKNNNSKSPQDSKKNKSIVKINTMNGGVFENEIKSILQKIKGVFSDPKLSIDILEQYKHLTPLPMANSIDDNIKYKDYNTTPDFTIPLVYNGKTHNIICECKFQEVDGSIGEKTLYSAVKFSHIPTCDELFIIVGGEKINNSTLQRLNGDIQTCGLNKKKKIKTMFATELETHLTQSIMRLKQDNII